MRHWRTSELGLASRAPQVLSSTDEARAIVLALSAGEGLAEHRVRQRAWMIVLDGEVELAVASGEKVAGGAGLLVELEPGERHAVQALADARLLLLLAPWPGGARLA